MLTAITIALTLILNKAHFLITEPKCKSDIGTDKFMYVKKNSIIVLCNVTQCLQADSVYCVMLYTVCRLYVLYYATQCLQTDCTSTFSYSYSYHCQVDTSVCMWNKFYIIPCSVWFCLAKRRTCRLKRKSILFYWEVTRDAILL